MIRPTLILIYLFLLLGSPRSDADEVKPKTVRIEFLDSHTIEVPEGWKRVDNKEIYQIQSGDGEVVFTATKYEAKKDGWTTFWKTRMKSDFPSLESAGRIEFAGDPKDYRGHPFSILCRYEGRLEGTQVVYYTVSINCEDFFVSANFVGSSVALAPETRLPWSIVKSIRPKEAGKAVTGEPVAVPGSKPEENKKPQVNSEKRSR